MSPIVLLLLVVVLVIVGLYVNQPQPRNFTGKQVLDVVAVALFIVWAGLQLFGARWLR